MQVLESLFFYIFGKNFVFREFLAYLSNFIKISLFSAPVDYLWKSKFSQSYPQSNLNILNAASLTRIYFRTP